MGCISSNTKQRCPFKCDNMFNVSVVRVQSECPLLITGDGCLEINSEEIVFLASDHEPVSWSLQHLRRYGVTEGIFSFEAGRRCATGPGIYSFRCANAEKLYSKFQWYINLMSFNAQRGRSNENFPAQVQQNANNYMEHTSLVGSSSVNRAASNGEEQITSIPNSTSTSEFPSIPSIAAYSNFSPNESIVCHTYLDDMFLANKERNNNTAPQQTNTKIAKKFTTIDLNKCSRNSVTKSDISVNAASFEWLGGTFHKNAEPNYVNVSLTKIQPPELRQWLPKWDSFPESINNIRRSPAVNYIILDLDQQDSCLEWYHKVELVSNHSLRNSSGVVDISSSENNISDISFMRCGSSTMPKRTLTSDARLKSLSPRVDTSGGYTRIDFLRTVALMKSANYGDIDVETELEESRLTRHSNIVRKSYSISD